jgi:hypothetical protein
VVHEPCCQISQVAESMIHSNSINSVCFDSVTAIEQVGYCCRRASGAVRLVDDWKGIKGFMLC